MRRPVRLFAAIVMALLAASALGMMMAAFLAVATSNIAPVAPSGRARVLAQTISEAMNCFAMFPVFTLPVAIFLAWKGADAKTAIRVSLAAFAGILAAFAASVGWTILTVHAPAGATEAQRASVTSLSFTEALYNGALLAILTVPGAAAVAWRWRRPNG
jgi:hypothetical protein